jgi:glucosamine kinase
MTDLVLGIDGGGTKTELAIADRHGHLVLHRIGAGIGPIETPDWPAVLAQLMRDVEGFSPRIAYASFGMPSYGEMPDVGDRQREVAQAIARYPHCVLNDVHTAYEGAFLGRPGVLLLAGTGSMVWACNAAGRHIRVGGWGHGYGDEGSAFWIGQEAVAMLSHCLDGRAQDMDFAAAMVAHLGLPEEGCAEALADWYHNGPDPRVRVAALAVVVDQLANAGNATAKCILAQASAHLALHVRAAWNRLPSLPMGVWAAVGSVLRSRIIAEHLSRLLETAPTNPALPPVGGALWRAATNAGWAVDAAWIDRLRSEFPPQS